MRKTCRVRLDESSKLGFCTDRGAESYKAAANSRDQTVSLRCNRESFGIPVVFTNQKGVFYYLSSPVLEQKAEEITSSGAGRPVGNLVHFDISETLEIVHMGKDRLQVRRLDFEGDSPGKRAEELMNLTMPVEDYNSCFKTGSGDNYAYLVFMYVFLAESGGMRKLFFEYEKKEKERKKIWAGFINREEPNNCVLNDSGFFCPTTSITVSERP